VKFNYKSDQEDKHIGFIAEDVPDLVATKDRKGLSPMWTPCRVDKSDSGAARFTQGVASKE
jgi:hypothetical protein